MLFQISDDIFWGYNQEINVDNFNNSEDILQVLLCTLEIKLQDLGLQILIEKLKCKKFHIPKFSNILNNKDKIIYICSHCHDEECNCN